MSKFINKIVLILTILFVLFSCKLVNFIDIEIKTSVAENQRFFFDKYIYLDFSYMPEYISTEKLIDLRKKGISVSIDVLWTEKQCRIKPSEGWELGSDYQLLIDGNIKTEEEGLQSVYINRHFKYGEESELFTLVSCSVKENEIVSPKQTLVFEFSKPVSQVSFKQKFQISPSLDFNTEFEGNKVYITPVSKWPINTYFTWTLDSIFSSDNYILDKKSVGVFQSEDDLELPVIENVSRVSISENIYTWLDDDLNKILIGNGIGFVFSQEMDYSSVTNAISFIPSLRGDVVLIPESDNKKYVFIPSSNYKINTDYKLTVATSCKDLNSQSLKKEYTSFFKSANEYLKVSKIEEEHYEIATNDIVLYDGVNPEAINTMTFPADINDNPNFVVTINIKFSKSIALNLRSKVADSVSFSLLFPAKSRSPIVNAIKWNSIGDTVSFYLSNFSVGTESLPVYYQISITGGENGIVNSAGEYLEESLCVTLKTCSE